MRGSVCARPRAFGATFAFRTLCTAVVALVTLANAASAALISPTSYSMPDGQAARFDYSDDTYDGSSEAGELVMLSEGTGDLTDGVISETSWNATPEPFVGWLTVNPTIRFNFADAMKINQLDFYFDDTEGTGGVNAPTRISLTDGTRAVSLPVNDTPERGQLLVSATDLGFEGSYVDATIIKADNTWVMLSEVQIDGALVPEPVLGGSILFASLLGLFSTMRRRNG